MNLTESIATRLQKIIASAQGSGPERLNSALRLLAKWRSVLIQNTILKDSGTVVLQGPFKGLKFIEASSEGCHIAKLIGCYEQPLHAYIEETISTNYDFVINIGCAEGYYAVGLARRMPRTTILAHDTDILARDSCKELADRNGVTERIKIGPEFLHGDFGKYKSKNVLVICDIEGGELELLDMSLAPSISGMDIIVESHECIAKGITDKLISRFKNTHDITRVDDLGMRTILDKPSWFKDLAHLDRLLAIWEWRSGPTPWLVMKARDKP